MPPDFSPDYIEKEARAGMADEIGDLFWFLTDVIDRSGQCLENILNDTFESRGIALDSPIQDFDALQDAAIEHANRFEYSKRKYPSQSISIKSNPLLSILYLNDRPTNSLNEALSDSSGSSNQPHTNRQAGEYFVALAYFLFLKTRLGVDTQDVIDFNQ